MPEFEWYLGVEKKVKICVDSYLEHQGLFPANKYFEFKSFKDLLYKAYISKGVESK